MNIVNEQENGENKVKGIALKSSIQKKKNSEEDSNECSDTKTNIESVNQKVQQIFEKERKG